MADTMHLQNMIHNLFENSIKYSNNSVRIEVNYRTNANNIELSISDNGIGIAANDLPHIFEKFYRGNHSNTVGIGLGLSYVKMLVTAHHGEVEVYSKLGKGSRFTIKLPL